MSTRRGAWVVSRKGFWGYPADAIANSRFLFTLPKSVLQWSVEKMCSFNFDHEAYGVKPSQRYGTDHQIKRTLKLSNRYRVKGTLLVNKSNQSRLFQTDPIEIRLIAIKIHKVG